jgi:bifunctional lysine-specific demethylase and histidyl-hydroxylase NO66
VETTGLLGVADVDHILSTMALRAPAFRVIKDGATLGPSSYTRRARIGSRTITDLIDVGRVYGHFADGATIVLQGLHRYWPPVTTLCRELEDILTHPVQANAYITPPVAQGLRVHADAHDVFALQTHGRKHWVVYEGEPQPAPDGSGATPTTDVQLWPGDCLYLPKGTAHAARTVDSSSIHLTLGIRTLTYADVLRGAAERAVADPAFDQPLPAGFATAPQQLEEELRERLATVADAIRDADVTVLAERAARRFIEPRAPLLTGQLQQLLAEGDVYDRTVVRRRPHTRCEVTRSGDDVRVVLADRTLTMPAVVEPAMQAICAVPQLTVADLREHLDEAGRVTLVRRLIREGLLMVVDE